MTTAAPRSKDDITADWLDAMLHDNGVLADHASVSAVRVEDVGVGRGYVCQTVRVRPTYSGSAGEAPTSLVAKVPTFMEWPAWVLPLLNDMVQAEHAWYREEQPSLPTRAPRCFGSVYASLEAHAILLEDCGALRHFTQADACTAKEAHVIVRNLARAHAHWWGQPRLTTSAWLPSVEDNLAHVAPIVRAGWPVFAERIVPRVDPAFAPVGERIIERFPELVREAAASAATLVHGDFRLENVLMGEPGSEDEVVILDWQTVCHGSGLRDLAYFLGQNLEPRTRESAEADLLSTYHQTLVDHGVTGYSRAQCETDYRLGLLIALWVPLMGVRGLQETEEPAPDAGEEAWANHRAVMEAGEVLIAEMASRNIRAILDTRAGELAGAAR